MADRSVRVTLSAIVAPYEAAMAKAAAATKGLGREVQNAVERSDRQFRALRNAGAVVGAGVAAGLGVATHAAIDFQTSLSRIQGLVGLSGREVAGMKDQVLALAGETARAPRELAEGLYFVTSAGLKGQTALDVLETSARGAAAGLGETQTIADALTSAINSYGASNLTAAHAGDVLTAAVREGKAEASALAPQLGQLLPVAAQLGISFDQVAAGVAFLSRGNGDAALSATQLNGILIRLLKGGTEADKTLRGVGLSSQKLREEVREKGLLAALTDLRARFGDDEEAMGKVFARAEGLAGVLSLTGKSAGEAQQVFDRLANAGGDLDKAFDVASHTTGFKMQQALAKTQEALIHLGDAGLPIVAGVAESVGGLADSFNGLPGPLQVATGGLLALVGAGAGALGGLGFLVPKIQRGRAELEKMGEAGQLAGRGLGFLTRASAYVGGFAAVIVAASALDDALTRMEYGTANVDKLTNALVRFGQQGLVQGELAKQFGGDVNDLNDKISALAHADWVTKHAPGGLGVLGDLVGHRSRGEYRDAKSDIDALDKSLASLVDTGQQQLAAGILEGLAARGVDVKRLKQYLDDYSGALARADTQQLTTGASTEGFGNKAKSTADQLKELRDAFFGVEDAQKRYGDAQQGVVDAQESERDAQKQLSEAIADQTRIREDAARAVQQAERSLRSAQHAQADSAHELAKAQDEAAQAQRDYDEAVKDFGPNSKRAHDALDKLNDAHFRLGDAQFNAEGASISVQDATRELADANKKLADEQAGVGDGAKRVADAQDNLRAAHKRVRDAQDELVQSVIALDDAQATQRDAIGKSVGAIDGLIGWLRKLQKAYPEVAAALQPFIDQLVAIRTETEAAAAAKTTQGHSDFGYGYQPGPAPKHRQHGGPVGAHMGYWVGEAGREWFQPDMDGRIVTASQLGRSVPYPAAAAAAGGPNVMMHNTFTEHIDPLHLGAELAWQIGVRR